MTVSIINSNVEQKYALISAAGAGDHTIVDAVPDKKIRVYSVFMSADAKITVEFQDGVGGPVLFPATPMEKGSVISIIYNPLGLMDTSIGNLLNLNLSSMGVNPAIVSGCLVYSEV